MMRSLVLTTVTAFLACLVLTPVFRDLSLRLGLVDRPDKKRKLHLRATPRTGGVPILLSYVCGYGALLLIPSAESAVMASQLSIVWQLLPPVAIIFFTGLADDWLCLQPWQKLAGQVVAALWAYGAGVRIFSLDGFALAGWLSCLITIGWLILCANAFNLIDGVDGLAAGVGLTATLTTLIAGLLHRDMMLAMATAPLAGCLVGFLRYNFNPASIFLGDSGSLLIGFLLGCYGVIWSHKSATMLGVAAPAMALALPLLEVALSIVRRFLRNEPIFTGDRGHIHHRLLDRGFTPRAVALVLYAACGLAATLSLLQSVLHDLTNGLVIALFGAAILVGVRYLSYAEFTATGRFLFVGLRPMLRAQVQLENLERSLETAATPVECWNAVGHTGAELGYSHMTARLGGQVFSSSPQISRDEVLWQIRVNLGENCWVNITQTDGRATQPAQVLAFADVLRRRVPGKLAQFEQEAAREAVRQLPKNSSTRTVISSDCGAPSVNAATAS